MSETQADGQAGASLLAEVLERVIRDCGEANAAGMAASRAEFDGRRGPVFEDEDLWETRTRNFLEWFAIEARSESGATPVERAIEASADPRTRAALFAWHRSYRCLAEIAELSTGKVLLIDLIGGAHVPVDERRGLAGVRAGDIAECRVVAFEGEVHFGGWFLWHPEGTRGPLLAHIAQMTAAGKSREEILDVAASLRVRSLRYSHVPASRVYESATTAQAPSA